VDFPSGKSVHAVTRACRPAKEEAMSKAKKKADPKPVKEPKPKKEKAPKEPQVVFAFRLSETDRDLIHRAAGPARATRFVRAAAPAAANQDSKAFDELTAQAKTNFK